MTYKQLQNSIEKIYSEEFQQVEKKIASYSTSDIKNLLMQDSINPDLFYGLLSDQADPLLDDIILKAKEVTATRFGKVVNLYVPLYLSNYCLNDCTYCFFGTSNDIERKVVSASNIKIQAEKLYDEGFRSILLVAGEDFTRLPLESVAEAIRICKSVGFSFVGVEIAPLSVDEYKTLADQGLNGVTLYQESYDRAAYKLVHPKGPKLDYDFRLESPSRIAAAGIRVITIGALLGLSDYRKEAFSISYHISYLNKHYWQSQVAVSFPRLKSVPKSSSESFFKPVTDNQLIRLIIAIRLFFPDTILTLSTRETATLRDRLFGAGINQVSAGSRTSPDGYLDHDHDSEQFPVIDDRSADEVVTAINNQGYDQVYKDWDSNFQKIT
ncbi:MAG: 2-iminoacetate synthase ThiH [Nitrospinota bacterium]